jgi:amino acid transporter
MAAVAASSAPIGDMIRLIGDSMLHGNGFMLMIVVAATVGLAVLGTTLAAMNTAVRISFAMAQDKEMPSVMGALHGRHATPHKGVWILVLVSAILGSIGVVNVTALTGITLASNIGTFILYALICGLTFISFAGRSEFHSGKHAIIPALGLFGNIAMLIGIVVIGLKTPGVSAAATKFALWMTAGWGMVSAIYLVLNSRSQKRSVFPSVEAINSAE